MPSGVSWDRHHDRHATGSSDMANPQRGGPPGRDGTEKSLHKGRSQQGIGTSSKSATGVRSDNVGGSLGLGRYKNGRY